MPSSRTPTNALVVTDVHPSPEYDETVRSIYKFVSEHSDEYKVVVATKISLGEVFHPELHAVPDAANPYSPDNVDFDSVFTPEGDRLVNPHQETLNAYLKRHNIGHIDFIGLNAETVASLATRMMDKGYTLTVFVEASDGFLEVAFQ